MRPRQTLSLLFLVIGAVGSLSGRSSTLFAQSESLERPEILRHAGAVHDLPPSSVHDNPVHLVGTITYYDPGEDIMFFEDESGGVYVNTSKPYPVRSGDRVELDGTASPSYRTEILVDPTIRVLGHGQRLPTKTLNYEELISSRLDCRMVTIRAKVRAADVERHTNVPMPSVHLDLAMPGGEVQAYLPPSSAVRLESLLDTTVELTGVQGGAFDAKYQLKGIILYVPDASSLKVISPAPLSHKEIPLTSIDDVFQSRLIVDNSSRIRVRGTITYYKKGDSAVLENDGKSIYVQTRGDANVSVGDVVDATGFATDHEYAPSLRQASLVPTGERSLVSPKPVNWAQVASGLYSDNLVSITGELVSQLSDPNSHTLVLNVEGHLVRAFLEQNAPIDTFQIGSRLTVTGVCRLVPVGAWRAANFSHIEMRGPSDIRLISNPSWYNVRHLIELLAGLITVAMVIGVWAFMLRRRVVHQTAWISRSMIIAGERSRILEMISSNHSLDEILQVSCDSVSRLLPPVTCTYSLYANDESAAISDLTAPKAKQAGKLYEVTLVDGNEHAAGKIVITCSDVRSLPGDSGEVYAMLSELSAIAMKQSSLYKGLLYHSTHDPLTELPNRRLCESRLASELRNAEQNDSQLAVIYIDVNCFKEVNDSHGHKTGDLYLQQISARLTAQTRSVDMLARVGGDEFVAIAPFAAGGDYADALTARLQACFDEPFRLEGVTVHGSASFGLARYPEDGTTAQELTRNADHAMYLAKNIDLNVPTDQDGIAIISSDELERALLRDQFRLAYQPQFSADGRLAGLEALIRLEDPVLGLLTPDAFITVAERHDVIVNIGKWVLKTALKDAIRWKLQHGEPLSVAVNVSLRQLETPGYADGVLECLRESSFPANRLELELVERSLVFSGRDATDQLDRLREAGVRISLDDFGTGQSSLSLLHKLPIDTIKLDRSFVRAIDSEPTVLPVIQAIVSMAHALGKRVVAEAIEHVGPVPTLLRMGTMDFQGYLLGRPILAAEVDKHIATWRGGIVMPQEFRQAKTSSTK